MAIRRQIKTMCCTGDNKLNTIKFVIAVSIVLVSADLLYHQTVNAVIIEIPKDENETNVKNQSASELNKRQFYNSTVGKSMVDKLIEDTKKNLVAESYRAELINRIENTTCLSEYRETSGFPLSTDLSTDLIEIEQLENILKYCVVRGIMK